MKLKPTLALGELIKMCYYFFSDIQPVEEQELAEAQPMEDDQQQAQVVQQAREDQHAQGYQQQMTGPGNFLGFLFLMIVSICM